MKRWARGAPNGGGDIVVRRGALTGQLKGSCGDGAIISRLQSDSEDKTLALGSSHLEGVSVRGRAKGISRVARSGAVTELRQGVGIGRPSRDAQLNLSCAGSEIAVPKITIRGGKAHDLTVGGASVVKVCDTICHHNGSTALVIGGSRTNWVTSELEVGRGITGSSGRNNIVGANGDEKECGRAQVEGVCGGARGSRRGTGIVRVT